MASSVFQIKAIRPRKRIDAEAWAKDIEAAMQREGDIVKRMYEKTTRTWSDPKPEFKTKVVREARGPRGGRGGAYSVCTWTDDQKFIWVDHGTKGPYPIRAKNKPYLIFKVGGKPKTRPRIIGSGAGKPGTTLIITKEVTHPGIKAREFSDEIRKRRRPKFFKNMKLAMEKAKNKHAW